MARDYKLFVLRDKDSPTHAQYTECPASFSDRAESVHSSKMPCTNYLETWKFGVLSSALVMYIAHRKKFTVVNLHYLHN